jgi:hypothetical protein
VLGRARRIALVAAAIALIPAVFSYVHALSQPSNSSVGIRTVEWLRDNGAAGLVAQIESTYYALTAPSKGGPTLRALPRVGVGAAGVGAAVVSEYRPARVHAMLHPALPGEGVWHATRPGLEAHPPVLLATLRDQPEYPRVVAGLAWINTKRTKLTLHPGRLEPSVSLPRGSMDVPTFARPGLLASFNSGFKLSDSHGGFVLRGHAYAPMQDGQGTLVGYANGAVDVVDWSYGATAPANVSFARQNLPLIVSEGKPSPNIANTAEWGATVGNAILVWRSGIGVDRRGNLIYAAGEDQTVASLAKALHPRRRRAGDGARHQLLLGQLHHLRCARRGRAPPTCSPSMNRSATRYLEPDDRDFFTVTSR